MPPSRSITVTNLNSTPITMDLVLAEGRTRVIGRY
jgi:hypothetical protein